MSKKRGEKKKKVTSGWKVSQKKDTQRVSRTQPCSSCPVPSPERAEQLQAKPSGEPGFDKASVEDFFL